MNGGTNMQAPRKQIDGLLNFLQVDLDSLRKVVLETKRNLLGPEVPTPEAEAERGEKIPGGWLARIAQRLNSFRKQLQEIRRLQNEVLNAVGESPELEEMDKQLRTEMKETIP